MQALSSLTFPPAFEMRPERKAYAIKTDGSGRGTFPLVHRTTFEKAVDIGKI
jgi:hypothetical protein